MLEVIEEKRAFWIEFLSSTKLEIALKVEISRLPIEVVHFEE